MSVDFDSAISTQNLGKCFRFYDTKWKQVTSAITGSSNHAKELWAIRNLNLEVPKGKTIGVIGQNGSGKTTLLQLLAGLLRPTEGNAKVVGNLATLLELGSGFHSHLTGRENIFVGGGLRGFSKKEVEQSVANIIHFSELEEFIDRPIRQYSAGMLMRLGFSIAISVRPDVLLIDEVFAVGDTAFQYKCVQKFRDLQKSGTSIALVSHDMNAVKSFCDQALLLDRGSAVLFGDPEKVTNHYLNLISKKYSSLEHPSVDQQPSQSMQFLTNIQGNDRMHRFGTGEGVISGIEVLNSSLQPAEILTFGEEATFRFHLEYHCDVPESGIGFYLRDRYGNDIVGMNTFEEGKDLGSRKKGDRLIVEFRLPLYLKPGVYSVSPGFAYDRANPRFLDWIDNAKFFELTQPPSGKKIHGFVHVPNQVSLYVLEDPA